MRNGRWDRTRRRPGAGLVLPEANAEAMNRHLAEIGPD
jgi:hypothetical protein